MSRLPAASLLAVTAGAHAGEQLALAALPLTAAVALGAGPETVGHLVAAQGAAWLVGSLPAGLLVDRLPRRGLVIGSQLLAAGGLALATLAAWRGAAPLLGLAAFAASLGTVIFVLALTSIVPSLVPPAGLGTANARLELARALATLAAPVVVGVAAACGALTMAYALACLCALLGAVCAVRLPKAAPDLAPARRPMLRAVREGADFVLRQPLLRGIALCAVLWNAGFFALLAAFVPFALRETGLDPAGIGLAQAGYGLGLILGAATAPAVLRHVGPNVILLAGPALSVLAPVLVLASAGTGGVALPFLAQALVGFGPMQWLICQTSIRQAVTPGAMLGRVGATIQVAIYGVRPLGALAGGGIAAGYGLSAAMGLVLTLFALSFVAVAASALARLRAMPGGA